MARQEYRFPHDLGIEGAKVRVQPVLSHLVSTYNLALEPAGDHAWRLQRPGVDVQAQVSDTEFLLIVELGWFLEKTLRAKIDDALAEKVAPFLK